MIHLWFAAAMAAEVGLVDCPTAVEQREDIAHFTSTKGERLEFVNLRTGTTSAVPSVFRNDECHALQWEHPIGWGKVVGVEGVFVGALDGVVDGPFPVLQFVISKDGGKSWTHTGTLEKPHYLADVRLVEFKPSGKGRVSFLVDDAAWGITTGMHRYQTDDWGKSWCLIEIVPLSAYQKK